MLGVKIKGVERGQETLKMNGGKRRWFDGESESKRERERESERKRQPDIQAF